VLITSPLPAETATAAETVPSATPEAQGSISTLHFEPAETRLLRDHSFLRQTDSLVWLALGLGVVALVLIVFSVLRTVF
jgi:hypothetical protein